MIRAGPPNAEPGATRLLHQRAGSGMRNGIARQGRRGDAGDPHVNLVIRALDERTTVDAYGLDGAFLVESELVLFAEDGAVRYEVIPVPPYEKRYRKDDLTAHG